MKLIHHFAWSSLSPFNCFTMHPYIPESLPLKELHWEKYVSLIGKANAEVARFDGLLQGILNPEVLLSPLTMQEAVLSSKIEGTQASLKDVLEFEADPQKKTEKYNDIKEILNYRKAMRFSIKELETLPLVNRLIKNVHKILLDSVRGQNKQLGNFRNGQVHIGKPGSSLESATFVPPAPSIVPDCMGNLENYFNYNEKDFLVQLAVIHAQFEIIHPFWDGNGRIGRILLPLFLYYKKVLSTPMFYLSAYFESHREEYYDKLLGVSKDKDWDSWIIYFLQAVIEQSRINIKKASSIHNLYDSKKEEIMNLTNSKYAIKTLDFIFSYPIFNSSNFIKTSKIPKPSAMRALSALEKGGLLKKIQSGAGRRPSTYAFAKLLSIVG